MDRYKLQYEMKKRGVTVDDLCKVIGINRTTFFRKCKGTSEFNLKEIQMIVDYLGLETPMGIFFAEKVS